MKSPGTVSGTLFGRKMRRRRFTLIEMLVVVTVLALLASVLFPSLSKKRESSYLIGCQDNLKLLGISYSMYINDNDGYLPHGIRYLSNDPHTYLGSFSWASALEEYTVSLAPYSTRWKTMIHGNYTDFRSFGSSAYTCPGEKWGTNVKPLPSTNLPIPYPGSNGVTGYNPSNWFKLSSYGMNSYLMTCEFYGGGSGTTTNIPSAPTQTPRISQIRWVSDMFLFSERYNDGFQNSPVSANWGASGGYLNFERHRGQAPVVMLDGHTDSFPLAKFGLNKYTHVRSIYFKHWGARWWDESARVSILTSAGVIGQDW